jgi:hypothetical protein
MAQISVNAPHRKCCSLKVGVFVACLFEASIPKVTFAEPPQQREGSHAVDCHSLSQVNLKGTAWGRIAEKHALDPYLLYAVALIESGSGSGGLIAPTAWAIRSEGGPIYHSTKADALRHLNRLVKMGHLSVDVGMMQINYRWHLREIKSLESLLSPDENINLGATILAASMASAPGDPILGVGRYHAWSNELQAHSYGSRVLRLAHRLRCGTGG